MCGIGGICKRLANVLIFRIREVASQVLDGSPRLRFDDHAGRDAHAPDTWLAAHDFGVGGYPAELLHVVRTAFKSGLQTPYGWPPLWTKHRELDANLRLEGKYPANRGQAGGVRCRFGSGETLPCLVRGPRLKGVISPSEFVPGFRVDVRLVKNTSKSANRGRVVSRHHDSIGSRR